MMTPILWVVLYLSAGAIFGESVLKAMERTNKEERGLPYVIAVTGWLPIFTVLIVGRILGVRQ